MKEEKQNKQDPRDIYKIDGIKSFVSKDQAKIAKDTWGKMGEIKKATTKTILDKLVEAQKDAGVKMTTAFNELSDRINEFVKQQSSASLPLDGPYDTIKWGKEELELIVSHIQSIKNIYNSIKNELPSDRELSLTITKLEEAEMWLTKAITH